MDTVPVLEKAHFAVGLKIDDPPFVVVNSSAPLRSLATTQRPESCFPPRDKDRDRANFTMRMVCKTNMATRGCR